MNQLKFLFILAALLGVAAQGATVLSDDSNPLNAGVGQPVEVTFYMDGEGGGSWRIGGTLPPGLSFGGLTAAGDVNAGYPRLSGTPTAAGTYDITVRASATPNQGGPFTNVLAYRIQVSPNPLPPAYKEQPSSATSVAGDVVTFRSRAVFATSYQWRRNGVNIPGATSQNYTTTASASTAGSYTVMAFGDGGSVTSTTSTFTVVSQISGAGALSTGQPLSLSVTVANPGGSTFQWKRDGVAISGANSATYSVGSVTTAHAGAYTVTVSNNGIPATTAAVGVTVDGVGSAPPGGGGGGDDGGGDDGGGNTSNPAARIINLSVRTNLPAGRSLIVGMVTNAEKNLLVRAVGPGLGTPGLQALANSTLFADPQIAFNDANVLPSVQVDANQDWALGLRTEFARLGAFDLPTASKDAALFRPVAGPHTAVVTGNSSGIVLVEVYDGEITKTARLINVSARNHVGTGADILIAGFVIQGAGGRTLLVRGVGPSLASQGVTGVIADPKIAIYDTAGNNMGENDNWNASLSATFAKVGAFPLDTGSKDAALVVTLPPGAYTALLSGVNGGTGEGLVEVYEVE